jgi:colanic acid/amylovoran biosynthesis glycosyltransferase
MTNDSSEVTRGVAVFRLQLFKPSEVFITEQARLLTRYQPFMLGREVHGRPPVASPPFDAPAAAGKLVRGWRAVLGARGFYEQSLRRHRPELVHAHFGVDAVAVKTAAARCDLPLVTTFHGFDATTHTRQLLLSRSPSLVRYAMGRSGLAQQGQLFICVSDFIRERVLALGFPEAKVVRHYIGTDTAKFAPLASLARDGAPVILHVARLVEKKGTADLLDAFVQVLRASPAATLVIIGDGPLRAALMAQAQALGVGASVRFLGVQPHAEVTAWLGRATVFCLPSVTAADGDTEGLPISIIEAAAAGLPIVATFHSGIPEAVQHEQGGLLVRERDVKALAAALNTFLHDAKARRACGLAAQRFVQQTFDLRKQAVALEALYDRATAG